MMDKIFASFTYAGQRFIFVVTDPDDEVQRHFLLGEFYEQRELETVRLSIPREAVVLDVGTNVGNHAVYFDKILKCTRVICFEPNPEAIGLLRENIHFNQALSVDLSRLGVGVGRAPGHARIFLPQAHNLGAAKLEEAAEGEGFRVDTLDNLLPDIPQVDFIKIDTEGMELDVLAGAGILIARFRPTLLVEVEESHRRGFVEWCELNHYRIDQTFQRYRGVFNYLCFAQF